MFNPNSAISPETQEASMLVILDYLLKAVEVYHGAVKCQRKYSLADPRSKWRGSGSGKREEHFLDDGFRSCVMLRTGLSDDFVMEREESQRR